MSQEDLRMKSGRTSLIHMPCEDLCEISKEIQILLL